MTEDVILMHFLFLFFSLKCCPSLLESTGIREPSCNFRNHSLFFATSKNSPTARCVLAANRVFKHAGTFRILLPY
jgi:hypothetical protein